MFGDLACTLGMHNGNWVEIKKQKGRLFDLGNKDSTIGRIVIITEKRICTRCGHVSSRTNSNKIFY